MCVVPIDDYSNLTRLGILDVDPGAVLGQPSPNAFKPLPYLPLNEPLQKPDFSAVSGALTNDTFVHQNKNQKRINKKSGQDINSLTPEKEKKSFNWKKCLGITSIALLAIFGVPKLIKNFPAFIKQVPQKLKNLFKKTP